MRRESEHHAPLTWPRKADPPLVFGSNVQDCWRQHKKGPLRRLEKGPPLGWNTGGCRGRSPLAIAARVAVATRAPLRSAGASPKDRPPRGGARIGAVEMDSSAARASLDRLEQRHALLFLARVSPRLSLSW